MNKKLMAVLALMTIASSAFAQKELPSSKRKIPDVIEAKKRNILIPILQVQECITPDLGSGKKDDGNSSLPAGVSPSNWCFVGANPNFNFPACRFVGGVLCIDPGPNGDWAPWFSQFVCPAGTVPVVQGVKLRKLEPAVPKCPDIYPGVDYVQTGSGLYAAGIRTFWALKFTPCNTEFRLSIEYACVTTGAPPRHAVEVHEDTFIYKVVVRPSTLRFVLEALHCQPLGACEIPCITDEGLFARLLLQADAIAAAAEKVQMGNNAALLTLNDAFDLMEATLVNYAHFTESAWELDKLGNLRPCSLFGGVVPSNKTIDTFHFGIVDTFENPCVCKLISDIVCLKAEFIGTDP